jgi:hypothetical protein
MAGNWGHQTLNNFSEDRKMVGLRNVYFATRFKLPFVKKMGHHSWDNKAARGKKKL